MSTDDPTDFGLTDKAAIVTGASSGLGAGIARGLAAAGAKVLLVARSEDRLEQTATAIRDAGDSCETLVANVTDADAPARIVSTAVAAYGAIDVLINTAGIFAGGPLGEITREQIDETLATNVRAPLELTQAAVPHMPQGAAVVFVGSNLAHYGLPGTGLYTASKGAIEALARTLAVELGGRRIRVNTISPGPVRTPMTSALTSDPEVEKAVAGEMPLGRIGEVADIVPAVCYLASERASGYVTGATLVLDGGRFLI